MTDTTHVINLDQLIYQQHQSGDKFAAELAPIANRLAADKLASIYFSKAYQ